VLVRVTVAVIVTKTYAHDVTTMKVNIEIVQELNAPQHVTMYVYQ
jgi:hypothetical protein